jgi:hypothetical protein
MYSHLSILSLSFWATWDLLRKSMPTAIVSRVFPALSCTSFKVSGLILRSLIHFELILIPSDRHVSSFSLLQADNQFSQQHLLKRLSLTTLSKINWAWIHIQVLYSVPLVFIICFCASTVLFLLLWLCVCAEI